MLTCSAGRCDPCHANALSELEGRSLLLSIRQQAAGLQNISHHLMPQYDWQTRLDAAFDFVKFCAAYSASCNTDQYFARVNFWLRQIMKRKRSWILCEHRSLAQEHGFHI